MFWVTTGSAIDCEYPENALHKGFLRTCRVEAGSRRFGSIDLDPRRIYESQELIVKVFANIFNNAGNEPKDFKFAERNGQILLPGLDQDLVENEKFINSSSKTEMQPFLQNKPDGRVLRPEVTKPGLLDSIVFQDDAEFSLPLSENWIEAEPRAYGINFRDVMSVMDQLDEKQELGVESAGVVTRVGPSHSGDLQPSTRVIDLTPHGHIPMRVRVPWHNVVAMPEHEEFPEAASVAAVFATAYFSMFDVARVEQGETMLVHAAAGGVLATVGSQEKREFLMKTYGLSSEHIFSSRDESFVS